MYLEGAAFLKSITSAAHFSAKMVFNARGAIIFPVSRQHRDMKADGISYEDDYRGNALAAMLAPGRIEVRYHQSYTDHEVAYIVAELLRDSRLAPLGVVTVTYQGRALAI